MVMIGRYRVSEVRKFVVAAIGAAVLLANSALSTFTDYLPPQWSAFIASAVGFVTAVSVFLVRNAPIIDAIDTFGGDESGRHAKPQ